jgi:membrane associated rhomboid family serine protease
MTQFVLVPPLSWRIAPGRVLRAARTVPFTMTLLTVLLGTTVALRLSTSEDDILLWVSTNVHNLSHRPVVSFVTSALFVSGDWLPTMVLLAAGLGLLERRVGTARTLAVFATGHVIATLVTEGAVWLDIRAGDLSGRAATQLDVGVSYGMWAVLGAMLVLLPARWRWPAFAAFAALVVGPLLDDFDMTAGGHTLAFAIGLAWWPILRARLERGDRAGQVRLAGLGTADVERPRVVVVDGDQRDRGRQQHRGLERDRGRERVG